MGDEEEGEVVEPGRVEFEDVEEEGDELPEGVEAHDVGGRHEGGEENEGGEGDAVEDECEKVDKDGEFGGGVRSKEKA